jgi:hypothetical protein
VINKAQHNNFNTQKVFRITILIKDKVMMVVLTTIDEMEILENR